MKGYFTIKDNDSVIARFSNNITEQGKEVIGKYLAGTAGAWADAIVIGAGNGANSPTIASLDLEFFRAPIDLRRFDSPSESVVLRAAIPGSVVGKIHEIGVRTISGATDTGARPLVFFDPAVEDWSTGVSESALARSGASSLRITPASPVSQFRFFGDIRSFTSDSIFRLAYIAEPGTSDVSLKIKSTDFDYREYSFEPVDNGSYQVKSWSLSEFDIFGNPDLREFFDLEVEIEGTGDVVFDAFTVTEEFPGRGVLVSRALVDNNGSPFIQKKPSRELQIEYSVEI